MMKLAHLVKRFFGSLIPFGPKPADDLWAREHLVEGEQLLWNRMSRQDRRHSIGVARRTVHSLGDDATRAVIAAALLHDVGKIESGLGTYLRVMATISAKVAGHDTAILWAQSEGLTRRIGLYVLHPTIGGDLLQLAGSDPLTSAWAREHHHPPSEQTVDVRIAAALTEADDD